MRTTGVETCIDNEGWCNGWDNDTICFSGIENSNHAYAPVVPQSDFQTGSDCGFIFGSPHPGGMMSLLCDGSARFLSFTVNATIWQDVCSENDGQTVTLP
ncbi:MAG: H-X9-DG-CTERM domain-containing protein [Thermoguttaceae bacterium]